MEGYKPKKQLHNVTYNQYPGLLISSKGTTIGKLQQLAGMKMTVNEQDQEKVAYVFRFFTGRVITWNLLHPEVEPLEPGDEGFNPDDPDEVCSVCGLQEGDLLPTTTEALYCLELSFVLSLIFGWMAAIASASDPKGLSSSNGEMRTPETQVQDLLMSKLAEMQNLPI